MLLCQATKRAHWSLWTLDGYHASNAGTSVLLRMDVYSLQPYGPQRYPKKLIKAISYLVPGTKFFRRKSRFLADQL